jgi:hypothetical protein
MAWRRTVTKDGAGRRCVADVFTPEPGEFNISQHTEFRLVKHLRDGETWEPPKPTVQPERQPAGMTRSEFDALQKGVTECLGRMGRGEPDPE